MYSTNTQKLTISAKSGRQGKPKQLYERRNAMKYIVQLITDGSSGRIVIGYVEGERLIHAANKLGFLIQEQNTSGYFPVHGNSRARINLEEVRELASPKEFEKELSTWISCPKSKRRRSRR